MDPDTLATIRSEFQGTSWALWSDRFPKDGCIEEDVEQLSEFIRTNQKQLDGSVVLLSLNPSAEKPASYQNFHSPDSKHYDSRLKRFIQDNGLDNIVGAFMTDIVPDDVTPNSGEVTPAEADIDRFLAQLGVLGKVEYDVICFSGQAFEALQVFFQGETSLGPHNITSFNGTVGGTTIDVHRVWHYSNWGANAEKVSELKQQLG